MLKVTLQTKKVWLCLYIIRFLSLVIQTSIKTFLLSLDTRDQKWSDPEKKCFNWCNTSKKNPTMTSYMVRVYPGSMAPSTVFIPIKITETSTAADIAARVAKQLKLELNNASLSEETPQATTDLAPGEYPFDR